MGWVGENVASGFTDGKALVSGWMHSPGHRANILSEHFRLMGIGAVKKDGVGTRPGLRHQGLTGEAKHLRAVARHWRRRP